jgi:hypothetical protein
VSETSAGAPRPRSPWVTTAIVLAVLAATETVTMLSLLYPPLYLCGLAANVLLLAVLLFSRQRPRRWGLVALVVLAIPLEASTIMMLGQRKVEAARDG